MTEEQQQQRKTYIGVGLGFLAAFVVAIAMFALLDVPASIFTKVISGGLLIGAVASFGGAARIKRDAKRTAGPS
ncbi:hypothetical protein [Stackebrandtia nassauensis]|uniref:Uncharacterized protein n=1 Tax=Stackebrandtia nassauensis (strain DSM 44728 / CIP 108903 / NRRL B-16338 / NBRC 102104 / LLR-40K-21) TaxID=446470 RepID=D3PWX6_STANL|nr:hypothetical protein [Stackebrandtia nassauensis]ADD45200.1 hypothetical protein Snas_5569 [Stackebrandtia nassauensis DSM 44728]